jgi:hypothetical protein
MLKNTSPRSKPLVSPSRRSTQLSPRTSPKRPDPSIKLQALKSKLLHKELQKLRSAPQISKISKALVISARHASPPKSSYVQRILQNNRYIKSLSSKASHVSIASTVESPRFAAVQSNVTLSQSTRTPEVLDSRYETSKSDIFSRGVMMIKAKEERMKTERKIRDESMMEGCTFSPATNKKRTSSAMGRPISAKSDSTLDSRKAKEVIRYKSLSPSPIRLGFERGCNLKVIQEKSVLMFRYLSLRMPEI